MEDPERAAPPEVMEPPPPAPPLETYPRPPAGIWTAGPRIAWVAGLVLMVSSFTDWYASSSQGLTLAVIGWHTGILGKLVFFLGLALFVLVRLISIPDKFQPGAGRGIGIWISLLAAIAVIFAGLLRAGEEL